MAERRMLHHISFAVTDLKRSAAFYDATLATLGYVRVWANASAVGYGSTGSDDSFAIKLRAPQLTPPGPGFHLAFSAPSRDAVVQFHQAALAHGGQDNGAPACEQTMANITSPPLSLTQTGIKLKPSTTTRPEQSQRRDDATCERQWCGSH